MWCNYLSLLILQWCNHWIVGIDKQFHPTFYNGLKISHISKRDLMRIMARNIFGVSSPCIRADVITNTVAVEILAQKEIMLMNSMHAAKRVPYQVSGPISYAFLFVIPTDIVLNGYYIWVNLMLFGKIKYFNLNLKVASWRTDPWASYQIRKTAGCACAGNAENAFSTTDFKGNSELTHVPWCMSGSLTRAGGENVPGIPDACATRNFTYLARSLWW